MTATTSVVIIHAGIANFGSIESIVPAGGGKMKIGHPAENIELASYAILPGASSFDIATRRLRTEGGARLATG